LRLCIARIPKATVDEVYHPHASCILGKSEARMGRYSQILLNFAYCLLVFCVADFRPLVIGGFFKLVVSLVLACLLAFVIVRLPNIGKLLASCPVRFFPSVVDRQWEERSQTNILVSNEPSPAPLFQRPPPLFSL
jgi:hypothetical protein